MCVNNTFAQTGKNVFRDIYTTSLECRDVKVA